MDGAKHELMHRGSTCYAQNEARTCVPTWMWLASRDLVAFHQEPLLWMWTPIFSPYTSHAGTLALALEPSKRPAQVEEITLLPWHPIAAVSIRRGGGSQISGKQLANIRRLLGFLKSF